MSKQPLLMQGEQLVVQCKAQITSAKGEIFLTNQRLFWEKMSGGKAFFANAGGGLLGTALNAVGKSNFSIPLNSISAIRGDGKYGFEFLDNNGTTYTVTLLPSGISFKGLEDKRDLVISYIQEKIS